ncbi:MAG: hypothetical protein AMXMBFR58_30270 [Phycisphaerae bacterium]|nr:hypothetical protein [Phycisphaerales bacterium]MCK6476026.1 hypothetical protein [Phycisphaerales bacterium]
MSSIARCSCAPHQNKNTDLWKGTESGWKSQERKVASAARGIEDDWNEALRLSGSSKPQDQMKAQQLMQKANLRLTGLTNILKTLGDALASVARNFR